MGREKLNHNREFAAPVQVQADEGPSTFAYIRNRSRLIDAVRNTVACCINSTRYISELMNQEFICYLTSIFQALIEWLSLTKIFNIATIGTFLFIIDRCSACMAI